MDVPLAVIVPERRFAEMMFSPGAATSGLSVHSPPTGPRELKTDVWSLSSVEPTVIADGARPGERMEPAIFELPAEMQKTTPAAVARSTACTSGSSGTRGPPRLMLTTST